MKAHGTLSKMDVAMKMLIRQCKGFESFEVFILNIQKTCQNIVAP